MYNILEVLGENIKYYREKSGLSQLKLAYQLEISPSYLVGIENAKQNPTLKIIEKLALFFEVDVFKLLMPRTKVIESDTKILLDNLHKQIDKLFLEIEEE